MAMTWSAHNLKPIGRKISIYKEICPHNQNSALIISSWYMLHLHSQPNVLWFWTFHTSKFSLIWSAFTLVRFPAPLVLPTHNTVSWGTWLRLPWPAWGHLGSYLKDAWGPGGLAWAPGGGGGLEACAQTSLGPPLSRSGPRPAALLSTNH